MNSAFIEFALNAIGPIVILLVAGKLLYARNSINDTFVAIGSRLVFNFALPALLFISISTADFAIAANYNLMTLGVLGTCAFFAVLMLFTHFTFASRHDRGVVIQGSFRANLGVVGLAYAANTFSAADFAQASVYMGSLILVYNVLSVWILNYYLPHRLSALNTVIQIVKNPIILSILVSLAFSFYEIRLPQLIYSSTEYFAQLTLPLALLCTGASIRFRGMQGHLKGIAIATVSKCILYPVLMLTVGRYFGFSHTEQLTVLFMAVAPTAVVSFIMVKNMGGNADLAANIVAVTTIVSIPATLIGYSVIVT